MSSVTFLSLILTRPLPSAMACSVYDWDYMVWA
uniref:Uncharacterized protein n=1 Tax=Podoviridae sp. ctNY03 TaxID=2823558 RepID=A0A8S5LAQ6_9CAUD|nr:MAG TPA: hypothetical protein [Podoviridae sp. ctNY03]